MLAARAALVLLAACGRIGFDPTGDAGAGDATPTRTARSVLQLDRDPPPIVQLDVPILVVLDEDRADFTQLTSAGRVRFFDALDDRPLPFEVEKYANAGLLVAWVRMPRVEPSGASAILVRYGADPGPSSNADVWPPEYVGVWHMSDGTDQQDATANGHVAEASNTGPAVGKIGDAVKLAAGDYLSVADDAQFGLSSLTISGWMLRTSTTTAFEALVTRQDGALTSNEIYLGLQGNQPYSEIRTAGPSGLCVTGNSALSLDRWDHLTLSYDMAAMRMYLNGVDHCALPVGGPAQHSTNPFYIGADRDAASGGPDDDFLDGRVDEIRIERVARTADWIALQHASMTDTLISYGAIQYE